MKKRLLHILIISICISLPGMILMQFFWIRNAFNVEESMFNQNVLDAMASVVEKMETRENMYFISRNFEGDSILQIVKAFTHDSSNSLKRRFDSLMAVTDIPQASSKKQQPPMRTHTRKNQFGGQYFSFSYQYGNEEEFISVDSLNREVSRMYHEMNSPGLTATFNWEDQMAAVESLMQLNYEGELERLRLMGTEPVYINGEEVIVSFPPVSRNSYEDFPSPKIVHKVSPERQALHRKQERATREDNIQKLDKKARKIQDMIKQMAIAIESKPEPVQQRINRASLQESLSKSLADRGISLPFEFAVYSPTTDSNHFPIRSHGFEPLGQNQAHRVSLFPNDLFQKPDLLMVQLKGERAHLFRSLSWLLAGSLLFTLVILLSSGASIVVMIRQKRISEIKTDFINNMTHEFKTPIATISIAADSINNPRVLAEPDTIKNFTRIIKEENNRMNTRVEQVLQMALLDSRDFNLKPSVVSFNRLIERVADHYRLQVAQREGKLILNLAAEHDEVLADEDHMRNVLLNLLDNANKYSLVMPEITVFSLNRSGKYYFGVKDMGIGMSPEVQKKVFDKFFRVTSGNIHNIKGFGLGLSYVKAIVLAHQGEISINSGTGRGSTFEIGLPLADKTL